MKGAVGCAIVLLMIGIVLLVTWSVSTAPRAVPGPALPASATKR
jgi:hypothetical protein